MRLDQYLTSHELTESREKAKYVIREGLVRINGTLARKPSAEVRPADVVEVIKGFEYVGRGGYKLEAAVNAFSVQFEGAIVADIGCSTGGFTDYALQHGARQVYAVDIGDPLHQKLRVDAKVTYRPFTDARALVALGVIVDITVIDVTFATLPEILEHARGWTRPQGKILALVKPPYAAGGRAHKIRDEGECQRVVAEVSAWCEGHSLTPRGSIASPLEGNSAGQREYWLCIEVPARHI